VRTQPIQNTASGPAYPEPNDICSKCCAKAGYSQLSLGWAINPNIAITPRDCCNQCGNRYCLHVDQFKGRKAESEGCKCTLVGPTWTNQLATGPYICVDSDPNSKSCKNALEYYWPNTYSGNKCNFGPLPSSDCTHPDMNWKN